jgi:hypothetical protein
MAWSGFDLSAGFDEFDFALGLSDFVELDFALGLIDFAGLVLDLSDFFDLALVPD